MASLHGHSQNPLSLPFQPPHIFTLIWQRAGDKTGTGIIVNQIKIVNNNKKTWYFLVRKMVSTGHRSSRGQKLSDKLGQKKSSTVVFCYSPSCGRGGVLGAAQCYSPVCRGRTNSSGIEAGTSKPAIIGRSTTKRGKTEHSKVSTMVNVERREKQETMQSSCYSHSCFGGGDQCYSPTCLAAGKKLKRQSSNVTRVEVLKKSSLNKSQGHRSLGTSKRGRRIRKEHGGSDGLSDVSNLGNSQGKRRSLEGSCYAPSCSRPGQCYSPLCNFSSKPSNYDKERLPQIPEDQTKRKTSQAGLKTKLKACKDGRSVQNVAAKNNFKRFVAVSPKIFRQERNVQDLLQACIKVPPVGKRKSICFDPALGKSRPPTPVFIPNLYQRKTDLSKVERGLGPREDDLLRPQKGSANPSVDKITSSHACYSPSCAGDQSCYSPSCPLNILLSQAKKEKKKKKNQPVDQTFCYSPTCSARSENCLEVLCRGNSSAFPHRHLITACYSPACNNKVTFVESQLGKGWNSKVSDKMEDDQHFKENLCSEVSEAGKDLSRNVGESARENTESATEDTERATEDTEHEEAEQMEGNGVENYGKENDIKEMARKTSIGETKPENQDKIESTEREKTPIKEKLVKEEDDLKQGIGHNNQKAAQNVPKVNSSGWGDQPIKRLIEPTQTGWVLKQ